MFPKRILWGVKLGYLCLVGNGRHCAAYHEHFIGFKWGFFVLLFKADVS
jgi:hypothetical protein